MRIFRTILILLFVLLSATGPVAARDMREAQVQSRQIREALLQKAAAEQRAAEAEAAASRERILGDRNTLEAAIAQMEADNRRLAAEMETLEAESSALEEHEQGLIARLAATDSMMRELVGGIRVLARDIAALIHHNLQTALEPHQADFLEEIAAHTHFPGMADIREMAALLTDTIRASGEVRLVRQSIINRAGQDMPAEVLIIGTFTAIYRSPDETGFLNWSPGAGKLFALARLPTKRMHRQITRYMDGEDPAIPMDISRGGALRQFSHALRLWEQIPKGGPIVYPILAILALGVLIVLERVIFLLRQRFDADGFVRRISTLAAAGNWDACHKACRHHPGKPVARVVKAGLHGCCTSREEMENALQEAILKEIPPMERFLSTLGMLAAIAPLLGLLGTVTGMINTFYVITQHGTGDPRMMSGGISEALVTTMLGLAVAIPLMMAHTWLTRAVDNSIGEMEEKAVALVNIAHQHRHVA